MFIVLNVRPQLASSGHRLPIDSHDDVTTGPQLLTIDDDRPIAALNARLRGRSAAVQDQHALLIGSDAELLPRTRADQRQGDSRNPQKWMAVVTSLDQLGNNPPGRVTGDSEADAFVAPALAENSAVDTDHLAGGVEQWSARVSGIDGCVGLNGAA